MCLPSSLPAYFLSFLSSFPLLLCILVPGSLTFSPFLSLSLLPCSLTLSSPNHCLSHGLSRAGALSLTRWHSDLGHEQDQNPNTSKNQKAADKASQKEQRVWRERSVCALPSSSGERAWWSEGRIPEVGTQGPPLPHLPCSLVNWFIDFFLFFLYSTFFRKIAIHMVIRNRIQVQ